MLSLSLRAREPVELAQHTDDHLIAYRRLALQLHHDLKHHAVSRSVLVVSPDDASTCALVAANVACCMAGELGRRVLLADATREGRLSSSLSGGLAAGLNDFLSDTQCVLEELLVPTSYPDVVFLPSGSRKKGFDPDNSAALLERTAQRHDFTVVAAGAILNDPFALASAPAYGAVLLLVVENETPIGQFQEASHSLRMCGVERLHVTVVERSDKA